MFCSRLTWAKWLKVNTLPFNFLFYTSLADNLLFFFLRPLLFIYSQPVIVIIIYKSGALLNDWVSLDRFDFYVVQIRLLFRIRDILILHSVYNQLFRRFNFTFHFSHLIFVCFFNSFFFMSLILLRYIFLFIYSLFLFKGSNRSFSTSALSSASIRLRFVQVHFAHFLSHCFSESQSIPFCAGKFLLFVHI